MEHKKYWIKLEKDFLNSSQIKVIKNMPNGKGYIIFYLALMLESTNTEGHLRFSELVPYNEEMLASVTDTNVDIVRSAMKIFQSLGMIQILENGTIFLPDVPNRVGKESESAERVRIYRERQKLLQCNADVTKCNDNKDKDIYKEKEINKDNNYQLIVDMYNEICKSLPKCTVLSEKRKKSIKARLNTYTLEQFRQLFTMAEESDFLKGKNNKDWSASFDWLLCDSNFAKVIDGNYKNRLQKYNNTQITNNYTEAELKSYRREGDEYN